MFFSDIEGQNCKNISIIVFGFTATAKV